MDYFINQTIHFDALNGLLSLIDNHDSTVHLSRPGSRLLTELITRSGKTITREDLLKVVWEEHGLRPSGSNLSNHISFLRKIFLQLGINENIIITVPKKGFRLEAEVALTGPAQEKPKTFFTRSNKLYNPLLSIYRGKKPLASWVKNTVLVSLVTIIFIVILFIETDYSFSSKKSTALYIDSCQLVDLSDDRQSYREEKLKLLASLIKENKINCHTKDSIIHFRFTNFFPRKDYDQQVAFLTQCHQSSKGKLTHCENFLSTTIKKP